MPDLTTVTDFLAQPRLAFAGASRDSKQFANTVYRELRNHGHTMLPIHPEADAIEGDAAVPSPAALAGTVGGIVVMLKRDDALRATREAVDAGVPRVWLHQGVGASSVSDEAVQYCRDHGVAVVDGACPLMFLEPVAAFHRFHRGVRRLRGAFRPAA
ncbi:MAG TPA: CoA-binding protein [Candidatus Dormibacteraeota bacterium]|nr:CoA-binding protein [Candidatus Dormibacteraeota bacterium]